MFGASDGVTWLKVGLGGKSSNANHFFVTNLSPPWTAAGDNTRHHYARLRINGTESLRVEIHGVGGNGETPVLVDHFQYTNGACR